MSHYDHGDGRPRTHGGHAIGCPAADPLLVVVPAFNEGSSVAAVVRRVQATAPSCDVLVIDDGSTDDTAIQARRAGAIVISLPFNLGIGGAVQTGFIYARDNGYGAAAQVDGDGQHDPAAIEKLRSRLEANPELDMAYGSRFLDSPNSYRVPISRRIGISLFAFVLTRLLGVPITDPTSGFRLCNRRAIEFFAEHYPHDYPEVEALLMLKASGLRFAEVPVSMQPRSGGRSSITRLHSAYYMLKVTLALAAGLLREPLGSTSPIPEA